MNKTYLYHFDFPDGSRKSFRIALDATGCCQPADASAHPEWTLLSFNRCPHCRLPEHEAARCPVAVNIADLVAAFHDVVSYDHCTVTCVSAERTVSKETDVQDGLRSVLGILMATSACPALDILRPMAWFHLPFGSIDESLFRSAATYLLRQYFQAQSGQPADFALARIKDDYAQVELVNRTMLERLRLATVLDADRNALVILNNLALLLRMEVDDGLERLRPLFSTSQVC